MEEIAQKFRADGAVDINELRTLMAMVGQKPSNLDVEKLNKLDTNKDGKIEKSEYDSATNGQDYDILCNIPVIGSIWGLLKSAFGSGCDTGKNRR